MEPYKTNPLIIERIWGGNKLSKYNKDIGKGIVGESWETGPLNGDIPILIKLIDARETLSVQVHPDDEFAVKVENARNGKSEAWIVLDCEKDSFIIYGFNKDIKKEEIRGLLENGLFSGTLNYIKVRKGDCVFVPAGTVHSIGKGILAYEVQQPLDLTYRIYDWDRTDSQGRKRELHIDKAAEAIDYSSGLPRIINVYTLPKYAASNIIECRYFELGFRILMKGESHHFEAGRFRAVTAVSGYAVLKSGNTRLLIKKGDTCIIPKEYDRTTVIEGLDASEYIVATCNL